MPAIAAPLYPPATVGSPACISSPQALYGRPSRFPVDGLGCLVRLGHPADRSARLLHPVDEKNLSGRDAEFGSDVDVRDASRALTRYGLLARHAASLFSELENNPC